MKTPKIVFPILTILLAVVQFACSSPQLPSTTPTTPPPGEYTLSVNITNSAYEPATLAAKPNTTVTWTNKDNLNHTVTSDTGLFDSGDIAPNATFSYTFKNSGSYPYHCTIHPGMKGTINVQ